MMHAWLSVFLIIQLFLTRQPDQFFLFYFIIIIVVATLKCEKSTCAHTHTRWSSKQFIIFFYFFVIIIIIQLICQLLFEFRARTLRHLITDKRLPWKWNKYTQCDTIFVAHSYLLAITFKAPHYDVLAESPSDKENTIFPHENK